MTVLSLSVIAYLIVAIAIGLYASLRVQSATDYVVAGRELPIYITIATVFATWFGSEAVLGIPATFIEEGLGGIVADPFGAGLCLIFVGVFFARKLYRMKLLTIGDFFKLRYNPLVEALVAIAICISYLGWVAAQLVALGLVIHILSDQAISVDMGMVIGLSVVMLYTFFGGMWAVALTDFIQMMIILLGLAVVAWLIAERYDGGAIAIVQHAAAHDKFDFWPRWDTGAILAFVGSFVTLALGSIPQQDVFQRVMSAKDETVAARATIIGGGFYMLFCFVPVFIIYGASLLDPALLAMHLEGDGDYQRILPEFILQHVPLPIQVIFFGALLSAIMSTASGTLLAPSVILAENILKPACKLSDKQLLPALRLCVLVFGLIVLGYAYFSNHSGLSIFNMVENAYLVTLCGAFVPLAFGVYWARANTAGALTSIALGVSCWVALEIVNWNRDSYWLLLPPQLGGLAMAIIGMLIGSYVGQSGRHSNAHEHTA